VSGRTNKACAIPSIQYWQFSKVSSVPVTGTLDVSVPGIAVVSAVPSGEPSGVPAMSVPGTVGEARRPIGPLVAIVVAVACAQAAVNSSGARAPNTKRGDIFFIFSPYPKNSAHN
jgi:hypothetical protein